MSTDDVGDTTDNDLGGAEDTLSPMEATDSDDVRNDDGDEVVDPPEHWTGADKFGMSSEEQLEGESLDQRLAEEEPDVLPPPDEPDPPFVGSDMEEKEPGVHRGQIDGTPEDGDSFYQVVE
ncbi:hypothetical protein ACQI4F_17550 [Mycolicibacterium vaccae]|uniref:hypothetical protein n=1 Tax=Mycolicibacterium vaccae TaxID=1810 RepID=UPI003CFBB46A